jgi:hypothetical protein
MLLDLPDPDPLVRGTESGIWIRIRTKMSRISNTVRNIPYILLMNAGKKGQTILWSVKPCVSITFSKPLTIYHHGLGLNFQMDEI